MYVGRKKITSIALCASMLISGMQFMPQSVYAAQDGHLSGTVYNFEYGKNESSGKPMSGATLKVSLNDDTADITSEENGSFLYEIPTDKKTNSGKYDYEIAATKDTLKTEGILEEGKDEKVYVKERYEASDSDYRLSDQEGVSGGVIAKAGTYTIEGEGNKKLSKTLDGGAKPSIDVAIDENGNIEPFYVYPDDTCSKAYEDGKVSIDREGPVINNVTTTAGDNKTYVKAHGIYAQEKAKLIIKASIKEDKSGLEEVYVIGKKDGQETRYEASGIIGEGSYTVSIGLPSEESILESETMYLVAIDALGNKTEALIAKTPDASSVTLEMISPEVSYSVTPEANKHGWYNSLPHIDVTSKDTLSGLASIEIMQDGKRLAYKEIEDTTTADISLSADANKSLLPIGISTIKIIAKDNAGNETVEEFKLKIDLDAPVISFLGVTEDASYNLIPKISVKTDEQASEEDGNIININVKKEGDSEGKDLSFEKTGEALIPEDVFSSDGEYYITASAVDAAGNESKEELIRFIYDTTKPTVSIGPTTQPNGNGWYKSLPTLSASSSDSLSGLKSFSIIQDGDNLYSKDFDERTKTIQTAEAKAKIDEASDDGSYTFKISAEDNAGNKAESSVDLKIDLVVPVLSTSGVKTGEHYKSAPSITIKEDEKYYKAKGAYIRYSLTCDGKNVDSATLNQVNQVMIPTSAFSKDGNYKLTVNAVDAAGNEAKPLTYSFVVDKTKPVITLSGAANGKFYNKPVKITAKVVERFFKTNNVDIKATRKLKGTNNVAFPWKNTGATSSSSKTFSETGTYTITATAKDKAGNTAKGKTLTFTVDTKAPVIDIKGVQNGKVYTYGESVAPKITVTDDYLASKSIVYTKAGQTVTNPDFSSVKENDGHYTLTVTATDKAGNTSKKEVEFTLNRFGSYFVYPDDTKAVMGKAMQTLDHDITISEHNVSKLEGTKRLVFRDGKKIEADAKTSEKLGEKENVYTHTFSSGNFDEEGAYEINVISKDEAGNEMESKDENGTIKFYIDRTAPTLSIMGIDPKGNKGETLDLTLRASDLLTGIKNLSVTANGEAVKLNETDEEGVYTFAVGTGLRQEIKVYAEDGAGNQTEISETASVSPSTASLFIDRFRFLIMGGIAAALAGTVFFILGKRRKNDEAEESNQG